MSVQHDQKTIKIGDPAVLGALKEFKSELKTLFQKKQPAIFLYGSYTRGQATPESDVDLLLLYSYDIQPSREIQRLSPILAGINLRYQVLISVLPTMEQNYKDSQEPFWKNVRREGISLASL